MSKYPPLHCVSNHTQFLYSGLVDELREIRFRRRKDIESNAEDPRRSGLDYYIRSDNDGDVPYGTITPCPGDTITLYSKDDMHPVVTVSVVYVLHGRYSHNRTARVKSDNQKGFMEVDIVVIHAPKKWPS